MQDQQTSPPATADQQRQQIYGKLTVQNILSGFAILASIFGAYYSLKNNSDQHTRDIQDIKAEQIRMWQYVGGKK